jgi:hypothetical protein
MSTHHHRDRLRVVRLFGRPYWWDTTPGRPLTLRPAAWLHEQPAAPSATPSRRTR